MIMSTPPRIPTEAELREGRKAMILTRSRMALVEHPKGLLCAELAVIVGVSVHSLGEHLAHCPDIVRDRSARDAHGNYPTRYILRVHLPTVDPAPADG